jgi:hypothetical protein
MSDSAKEFFNALVEKLDLDKSQIDTVKYLFNEYQQKLFGRKKHPNTRLRWSRGGCNKLGCYVCQLPDYNGIFGDIFFNESCLVGDIDGVISYPWKNKTLFIEAKHPDRYTDKSSFQKENMDRTQDNFFEHLASYDGIYCMKMRMNEPDGSDISHVKVWGFPEYESEGYIKGRDREFVREVAQKFKGL